MITWAQLAVILEHGQAELKVNPFELLPSENTPHSSSGIALNRRADVACRYFAAYRTWPMELTTSEKRLLVRRVLFALSIIQAMKASGDMHPPDSQMDLDPSTRKPKDALEWLLIRTWKSGGPKIMTYFEEVLQASLVLNAKTNNLHPQKPPVPGPRPPTVSAIRGVAATHFLTSSSNRDDKSFQPWCAGSPASRID